MARIILPHIDWRAASRLFVLGVVPASMALFCSTTTGAASGIFGGGAVLDASYCALDPPRQTIVYLDDSIIVQGKTDWAHTLAQKLQQTLMPGERTTVVELSPLSGQSKEIWTGCWPGMARGNRSDSGLMHRFFSGDPGAAVKEQQGFFIRDFGAASTKVYRDNARPAAEVAINLDQPTKKSLIRALSSDGARYAAEHGTIRVLLYSDMAENSELGSVYKTLPDHMEFADQLGMSLHRSVFYVFGLGTDIADGGHVIDDIRRFWIAAFNSMGAGVAGIGSDLSVPNSIPVDGLTYEISLKENGNELHGRMSLLWDNDGRLIDSWIGVTRLRSVLLNGYWRCLVESKQCELSATTMGSLVTDSKSETLSLKRSNEGKSLVGGEEILHGTIGVPGSQINLPISATMTKED